MPDQGTTAPSIFSSDKDADSTQDIKQSTSSTTTSGRTTHPMVIPQLSSEKGLFGSPFARAYPSDLSSHNISKSDFLTFLDGFNDTFVSSITGQSLSFAHRVLQLAYGHKVVDLDGKPSQDGNNSEEKSYSKIILYLNTINKDIFHPAGLKAEVLPTESMTQRIGYPSSKLKLLPTTSAASSATNGNTTAASPSSDPKKNHSILVQRMAPLASYVSDLDYTSSSLSAFSSQSSAQSENFFRRLEEARFARKERVERHRRAVRDRIAGRKAGKGGAAPSSLGEEKNGEAAPTPFGRKGLHGLLAEREANRVYWLVITELGVQEKEKVEDGDESEELDV